MNCCQNFWNTNEACEAQTAESAQTMFASCGCDAQNTNDSEETFESCMAQANECFRRAANNYSRRYCGC